MSEARAKFELYIKQLVQVQNKLAVDPENAELLKTKTEMEALLKSTRQTFTEIEEQTLHGEIVSSEVAALQATSTYGEPSGSGANARPVVPDLGDLYDAKGYIMGILR